MPVAIGGQQPGKVGKPETREWRKWEGVNVRDSRTGIGDTEFSWLQNMIPIGSASLQVVHAQGQPVYTYEPGLGRMWGFQINTFPVLIAVGLDGSMHAITPSGGGTMIAAPGTLTLNAWVTMWSSNRIMIVDPILGLWYWDGGPSITLIDANITGSTIAVFQERVWIGRGRTVQWSAPGNPLDFSIANGGGFQDITDSVFIGDIVALVSALEQLWVVGQAAIDAISNVQASGSPPVVVTTFSTTNIVASVGSPAPGSVLGYFRALTFGAPFGVHALSGVTPQKISEKLDSLSKSVTGRPPYFDFPSATGVIEDNLVLCFLTNYIGRELWGVDRSVCPASLLLCFVKGQWFFGYQGQLAWITTLVTRGGLAQVWGHDETHVYQCFAASACTPIPYKATSKFYDFGSAVTVKAMTKLGVELRAQQPVTCGCNDIVCIEVQCPPEPPTPPPAVDAITALGPSGVPMMAR